VDVLSKWRVALSVAATDDDWLASTAGGSINHFALRGEVLRLAG